MLDGPSTLAPGTPDGTLIKQREDRNTVGLTNGSQWTFPVN